MSISQKFSLSLILVVFVVVGVMVCATGSAVAEPSEHPFEIVPGSFKLLTSTSQAGAHEDLTTEFDFAHDSAGHTFNDVRTVVVNLPAGFMASNTAVPTCTFNQLLSHSSAEAEHEESEPPWGGTATNCPAASQVGTIAFDLDLPLGGAPPTPQRDTFPVYNMQTTSYGVTAELAYKSVYVTGVLLVSVRPGDSGLTVVSPDIEQVGEPRAISVTTWGVPADPSHDPERGLECYPGGGSGRPNPSGGAECFNGGENSSVAAHPFLSDPTSCGPFTGSMKAESWEEAQPDGWLTEPVREAGPLAALDTTAPITGCERVRFEPSIEARPTTDSAESSSGLDVSLVVPQTWEEPFTLATSALKDVTVALPEGYTVNPSEGNGLAGCTPAQYEAETFDSSPGVGCPPESKLGKVVIETPVLAEKITGNVYLAQPYDNPFSEAGHPNGSLLAMYMVAKAPDRGVIVKAPGKVSLDPSTGRITATFEKLPQQPFSRATFELTQGQTSPLVSPPACGKYTAQAQMTPWASVGLPGETSIEPQLVENSLTIEHGIAGGACPAGGVPPFNPRVISGTQNNDGGSYSPFYLRIERQDGEQEITRFSTTLPPGLTGNLSGIPFCPDASIEAARFVSGAEEEANPSCPAASEIGHTIVEAGVGTVLAQTPGKIYLAGPYHGAPLSIVSITSAKVGPFDLGTVVVRFALDINPVTAQVEVSGTQSEAIPHIIKGIVVHVRDIRVYMDRSKFIINPTDCSPLSITNTIDGAGGDPTNPADQVPVGISTPFEAADCSNLTFKPDFSVTTSAKTSRADGASLTAKLTVPGALGTQTNITKVKVELPEQLPSRLPTLQKACTAAQFETNPAGCPAASIIGHAKAITPILPVPLEGPAYFVSHGGEGWPSLVVVLQGYGFTIDLTATTFISKAGVTSTTFKTVPDQPVTSFELTSQRAPTAPSQPSGTSARR